MSVEIIRVPKAPPQGLGQGNIVRPGHMIDADVVEQLQRQGYTLLTPRRSARLATVPPRSLTGAMDPPGAYGWLYFRNIAQESRLKEARAAAAASRRAKRDAAASGEVSMDADSAPAAAAAAATSSAVAEPVTNTDEEEELANLFAGKMGFGGRRRKHRTRKSRKTRRRKTRRRKTRRSTRA